MNTEKEMSTQIIGELPQVHLHSCPLLSISWQSHWQLGHAHHYRWEQAGPAERPGHPPLERLQPSEKDLEMWLH